LDVSHQELSCSGSSREDEGKDAACAESKNSVDDDSGLSKIWRQSSVEAWPQDPQEDSSKDAEHIRFVAGRVIFTVLRKFVRIFLSQVIYLSNFLGEGLGKSNTEDGRKGEDVDGSTQIVGIQ
jgi:hypothetical protein